MGLFFRRSISFGPFRLNLTKSGVGVSTGIRGLRLSHGPRGTFFNASIPGTGIYYRQKLGGPKGSARSQEVTPIDSTEINSPEIDLPKKSTEINAPTGSQVLEEAISYMRGGNIAAAMPLLRLAVERFDSYTARFYIALISHNASERKQFVKQISENINKFPLTQSGYSGQLKITENLTVNIFPDQSGAILLCSEMFQADGDADGAISLISRNLRTQNKVLLVSLMELYVLSGRYEAALDVAAPYLRRISDPCDMLLNYYALAVFFKQGRFDQAKETALAIGSFQELPRQISENVNIILGEISGRS